MNEIDKTYNENRNSIYKRKLTRDFLDLLKSDSVKRIERNKIYLLEYAADSVPTDKWHRICIVYVEKIHRTFIEGYNLLYFNDIACLNFLKITHDEKNVPERIKKQLPYLHVHSKSYSIAHITSVVEIELEKWGLIPLLKREVFGNINLFQQEISWKEEQPLVITEKKNKKKKTVNDDMLSEDEFVEIDIEDHNVTLDDIRNELIDLSDDDDDI